MISIKKPVRSQLIFSYCFLPGSVALAPCIYFSFSWRGGKSSDLVTLIWSLSANFGTLIAKNLSRAMRKKLLVTRCICHVLI